MADLAKRFKTYQLENKFSITNFAREGINTAVFYSFANTVKIPEKTLATLIHLHPRTIQNYKDQQKNLEPVESEHLLKLIALFAKGEELLGSISEFNSWLKKPFWNGDETPMEWLTTPGGVDLISEELDRLAHGYAV